jgi:peptidoglycan/xylan/chitin deacetylase (PgdA/CDA1 family)
MRLFRPSLFARLFYPEALFRVKTSDKVLYLTFDDGPDSLSTLPMLHVLSKFNAKAVFFCKGKAAFEHPEIMDKIRSEGHLIGNHSYDHPDGFYMENELYFNDIRSAAQFTSGNLFRPPYGRFKVSQYNSLKKTYSIIMWDIMPYDFDDGFGSKRVLKILKRKVRPGSVIVLHDTSTSLALDILPEFLKFAEDKGYRFILPEIDHAKNAQASLNTRSKL